MGCGYAPWGQGNTHPCAAVIVSEQEVSADRAVVRDLVARSQQTVPNAELAEAVERILR